MLVKWWCRPCESDNCPDHDVHRVVSRSRGHEYFITRYVRTFSYTSLTLRFEMVNLRLNLQSKGSSPVNLIFVSAPIQSFSSKDRALQVLNFMIFWSSLLTRRAMQLMPDNSKHRHMKVWTTTFTMLLWSNNSTVHYNLRDLRVPRVWFPIGPWMQFVP